MLLRAGAAAARTRARLRHIRRGRAARRPARPESPGTASSRAAMPFRTPRALVSTGLWLDRSRPYRCEWPKFLANRSRIRRATRSDAARAYGAPIRGKEALLFACLLPAAGRTDRKEPTPARGWYRRAVWRRSEPRAAGLFRLRPDGRVSVKQPPDDAAHPG